MTPKHVLALVVFSSIAAAVLIALDMWIRFRWPAKIPSGLAFEHELLCDLKLREIAEALVKSFRSSADGVVCLGIVRGSAARVLFHSGPRNRGRNVNLHRHDYLIQVVRLDANRVKLRLELNVSYSHLRVRRSEAGPLVHALRAAFGSVERI